MKKHHLPRSLRQFMGSETGTILPTVALVLGVLILLMGAAIDIAQYFMVKARLQHALDLAGLAVGSRLSDDADDLQTTLETYFFANYPDTAYGTPSAPSMILTASSIDLAASAEVPTLFLKVTGISSMTARVESQVIRENKGLEVVLVLDNTGSMRGSKLESLRDASHLLVDTLFGDQSALDKVKVGIVPYSAAVNPGDELGFSLQEEPSASEDYFDTMRHALSNIVMYLWNGHFFLKVKIQGFGEDIYDPDDLPLQTYLDTNYPGFDLIAMTVKAGRNRVRRYGPGEGELFIVDDSYTEADLPMKDKADVEFNYGETLDGLPGSGYGGGSGGILYNPEDPEAWKGCVRAREYPDDISDSDMSGDAAPVIYWWESADDNIWPPVFDDPDLCNNSTGPNTGCPTPITPLTNQKEPLVDAINAMEAWCRGGTLSNIGMTWGWRVLSPEAPFTEGLPYDTPGYNKVAILMTDGINQLWSPSGSPFYSDYSAYGRLDEMVLGTTSKSAARAVVDDRLYEVCQSMKDAGIIIYTITFKLGDGTTKELFRSCATNPTKYFDSPTSDDLTRTFRVIGAELSNLRISH